MTEEKPDKEYNLIIGRHVPVKSPHYLLGAVEEALSYGSNALMVYLGAPQNSKRRSFNKLKKKIPEFKEILKKNNLEVNNVIVHGPYLLNLANVLEEGKFEWSVEFLREEMIRMKEVGLKTIVIHPGSALSAKPELALSQIAKGINLVFDEVSEVQILLETMCGRGSEVGINFEQLNYIMDRVEQKERIGICWDTCHLYTAGYDIKNNLEGVIKEFEKKIGLDKLRVIHVNDSLHGLGAKLDRHANIGVKEGKIGLEVLRRVVWHPKFNGIIKLLETPRKTEDFREEIRLLKSEK